MGNKLQITLGTLEEIVKEAKRVQKFDNAKSNTVTIEVLKENDSHLGGDCISVWLKSAYAECDSTILFLKNL